MHKLDEMSDPGKWRGARKERMDGQTDGQGGGAKQGVELVQGDWPTGRLAGPSQQSGPWILFSQAHGQTRERHDSFPQVTITRPEAPRPETPRPCFGQPPDGRPVGTPVGTPAGRPAGRQALRRQDVSTKIDLLAARHSICVYQGTEHAP